MHAVKRVSFDTMIAKLDLRLSHCKFHKSVHKKPTINSECACGMWKRLAQ